jgi:hypothetical protein
MNRRTGIAFGEMRQAGIRAAWSYCSDFRPGQAVSANP